MIKNILKNLMSYFNLAVNSLEEVSQELEQKQSLLEELQMLGYLNVSYQLQEIMKKNSIASFSLASLQSDYEGGYMVRIGDIFCEKNGTVELLAIPKALDWGQATEKEMEEYSKLVDTPGSSFEIQSELQTWCGQNSSVLNSNINVELDPYSYRNKIFTQEIDNLMSITAPPELYQKWKIIAAKNKLEQEIQKSSPQSKKQFTKI